MEIDSSHLNDNAEFNKFIHGKKDLQQLLLDYLETVDENNELYLSLIHAIDEQQINQKNDYLIEFLHLLETISNNHYRCDSFPKKIEKIINYLKNEMNNNLSEQILFNIFKNNKKILLYLFDEKIIIPTKTFADKFSKKKYVQKNFISYFYPELKKFDIKTKKSYFEKEEEEEIEIDEEKRKIGENDNEICHFIRDDLIKEFIIYVNKNNYSLKSKIKPSIYETNPFLINKTPTLIEYSVFFGSIQIIKYLQMNKIELTNSLWMYAIHGNQPEVIHLLEEFQIQPENNNYEDCFIESIKCHHNQIADYIKLNYLSNDFRIKSKYLLKYFNYAYFDELDVSDESLIYYLCKYDYPSFTKFLMQPNSINDKHSIIEKIKNKGENRYYEINYKYKENNKTLLFIATEKENYEIVKYLLSFPEININEISTEKLWMHESLGKDNINENDINWWKNELYDWDIDGESENRYEHIKESTPLNIAIKKENLEIVKLLLSNPKIDLNIKSIFKIWYYDQTECRRYGSESTKEKENTALYISIKKENIEILKLLLSHQNLININEKSIHKQSYISTEKHIWKDFDGSEEEITPLSSSIKNNNDEIIKLLLSHHKIDVKNKLKEKHFCINYESSFDEDIYQIHNFLVQERIKEIDEDYKNNSKEKNDVSYYSTFEYEIEKEAFHIAINEDNFNVVQLLLSLKEINVNSNLIYRGNNDEKESSPLFLALLVNNSKIFNLLYPISKIDVNKKYAYKYDYLDEKTLLHVATMNNNLEIVQFLLSFPEIDINSISTKEETALHIAVKNKNLEIAKLLLSRPEINVNAFLKGEGTALHIISGIKLCKKESNEYNNCLEILKLLLSNPAIDVNANLIERSYVENKTTALHLAVMNENLDFLELLLSHPNIDINSLCEGVSEQKVIKRKTALHIAVQKGNLDIILLLLTQPKIDIKIKYLDEKHESTLLCLAAECKKLQDSEYLLKNYSIDKSRIEKYNSIKNNCLEVFNLLLSLPDVDINEKSVFTQGSTNIEKAPLNILVENGLVDFLKSLLSEPNLDINSRMIIKSKQKDVLSMTALHSAIKNLIYKKFENKVSYSQSSIKEDYKYLLETIKKENIEIIKLLLSHPNIDVNEKCIEINDDKEARSSALHMAISEDNIEIIKLLLSHPKIDVNSTASMKASNNEISGLTALHDAVKDEKVEIVELLLSHPKINVFMQMTSKNSSNFIQLTPLHLAFAKNNPKIINLLLKKV